MERDRQGSSSTFRKGGPKTKILHDFKSFLLNSDNKKQFIKMLLSEWQSDKYAVYLKDRQLYFVCETECVRLESHDGHTVDSTPVHSLNSIQEEVNTQIILHCLHAAQSATTDTTKVIVRSPDIDVLVLVLLVSYSDRIC